MMMMMRQAKAAMADALMTTAPSAPLEWTYPCPASFRSFEFDFVALPKGSASSGQAPGLGGLYVVG